MRDLLVILPVRQRPASLPRFLAAFAETADVADLLVVTDDDDDSYCGLRADAEVVVQQALPTAPKVNRAARRRAGRYRALMFMGDDNVPLTRGWDSRLLDALDGAGGTGIAYANDLTPQTLPCSALISSDIVTALGWMCEPSLCHFFIDEVWQQIGEATTLTYLPDVVIEHRHPVWGKGPADALYVEASRLFWERDQAAFARWTAGRKARDLATVGRKTHARLGV